MAWWLYKLDVKQYPSGYTNLTVFLLLGAVAVNITQASYTRPRKAIRWSNVHCTGMESSLSRCSHYGHQLPEGIQLMDKLEVAGVSCQRDIPTNMRILQSGISTAVFTALIWALLLTVMLVTRIPVVYTCVSISCVLHLLKDCVVVVIVFSFQSGCCGFFLLLHV